MFPKAGLGVHGEVSSSVLPSHGVQGPPLAGQPNDSVTERSSGPTLPLCVVEDDDTGGQEQQTVKVGGSNVRIQCG